MRRSRIGGGGGVEGGGYGRRSGGDGGRGGRRCRGDGVGERRGERRYGGKVADDSSDGDGRRQARR